MPLYARRAADGLGASWNLEFNTNNVSSPPGINPPKTTLKAPSVHCRQETRHFYAKARPSSLKDQIPPNMPHSVPSAEDPDSAPSSPIPMEEPASTAVPTSNSHSEDDDVAMAEAGDLPMTAEHAATPQAEPPSAQAAAADDDVMAGVEQAKKPDIKLEDLFAGMDSDDDEDEFPSSSHPVGGKQEPE